MISHKLSLNHEALWTGSSPPREFVSGSRLAGLFVLCTFGHAWLSPPIGQDYVPFPGLYLSSSLTPFEDKSQPRERHVPRNKRACWKLPHATLFRLLLPSVSSLRRFVHLAPPARNAFPIGKDLGHAFQEVRILDP
ncbi:hypothetical protein NMY22_g14998 [Coprinellus aureogranulatus]|nr:hypothetical protein NMY22_g14998 [Coprinellus aureogranulatus]